MDPPSPRSFAREHIRSSASYQGCSSIRDYELLGKLGEGTFGEVHKARSRTTGSMVAMKKIIMHNEKDGFPITALREIKLLKLLSHKNVLKLEDMAVERPQKTDKRKRPTMYMVTPYMDHDLSGLLDNPAVRFTEPQIKCYLYQLLEGLKYLHENHILHRDMKAANLLINNRGILQIADFGLARHYEGDVPMPGHGGGEGKRDYTSLVVTRWYRPPELLLQLKRYTCAIDVWGVGCVFGEMLTGKPILAGASDVHQLEIIWELCGTPTEDNMPGWRSLPGAAELKPPVRPGNLSSRFSKFGPTAVSLLSQLLMLDWRMRINAMDALQHPYFRTAPLPARPEDIPTFEDSHELDRRKFDDRKAALPPAPKGGTVGRGHGEGGGAHGPHGPHGSHGAHGPPHGPYGAHGAHGAPAGFDGDGYGRNGNHHGHHGGGGRHPPAGYPMERMPRGGGGGVGPGVGGGGGGAPPLPGGSNGDYGRRPAWSRDRQQHSLPPRPPAPVHDLAGNGNAHHGEAGYRDRDRDRERDSRDRDRDYRDRSDRLVPPRSRGRGSDNMDTYVPNGGGPLPAGAGSVGSVGSLGSGRDVAAPWDRDRDRRRHDERDEAAPGRYGRERFDGGAPRTSRSRSPVRDSRDRDRDRDVYRR